MESDFSFLRGQSYFSSTVNWTIFLCFFFVNNFRKCRTRRCVRFYHLATIRLMCTLYSVYNVMVALLPWSQYKIRAHNRWTRTEATTTKKNIQKYSIEISTETCVVIAVCGFYIQFLLLVLLSSIVYVYVASERNVLISLEIFGAGKCSMIKSFSASFLLFCTDIRSKSSVINTPIAILSNSKLKRRKRKATIPRLFLCRFHKLHREKKTIFFL